MYAYSGLQNCVSIISIMTFDIIDKVLNFESNPYISSMTIDNYCTQFCKAVYMSVDKSKLISQLFPYLMNQNIATFSIVKHLIY